MTEREVFERILLMCSAHCVSSVSALVTGPGQFVVLVHSDTKASVVERLHRSLRDYLPAGLLLTVATETSYGFSVTGVIPGDELDGVTVDLEALP